MNAHILQPSNASWLEISKSAFNNNIQFYKKHLPHNLLLGAVLKANAYGHGFTTILPLVYLNPIDIIFVINPHDAFFIRQYEKNHSCQSKRVVVIGALTDDEIINCTKQDIEIAFGNEHILNENLYSRIREAYKSENSILPLKIHVFLDTGFGREGVSLERIDAVLTCIKENQDVINLQAVMSHFVSPGNQIYSDSQTQKFLTACQTIMQTLNIQKPFDQHLAQSEACLIRAQDDFNIVRVGIGLYGLYASNEMLDKLNNVLYKSFELSPILSWKVRSQSVRELPTDSPVGYNLTYITKRATRIALLPVGYYDGYPFALSNKGCVLVNGKKCHILGRVMMNYIVVDITDATQDCAAVTATLVGSDGNESITIDELAKLAGTINYEFATRIGAHLKRIVVD